MKQNMNRGSRTTLFRFVADICEDLQQNVVRCFDKLVAYRSRYLEYAGHAGIIAAGFSALVMRLKKK